MFSLEVDGLDGWIPARLDLDEATLRAELAEPMSSHPPEAAGFVASMAASLGQSSRERNEPPLLAMWARYTDTRQTVPEASATLRMMPVDADETPLSFANGLTADYVLHRPFELASLATKSGEAFRFVAITREDDERYQFARHDIVFWIRPADGEGMVLLTTSLDLVKGEAMAADLAQLATGVQWSS